MSNSTEQDKTLHSPYIPQGSAGGERRDDAEKGQGKPEGSAAEAAHAAGKAQVRRILIARLDEAGLRRGHGVTQDAHAARVDRIVDRLAYMTPENLQTLAELVLTQAQGSDRDTWPPEVAVVAWGRALQLPPLRDDRIVSSWLASVEGPIARAGGWHVQLYRFLRARRLPPQGHDKQVLQASAYDDARRLRVYQERIEKQTATPDERTWVAAFLSDARAADAIIDQGDAARAAKRAAAGAEGGADAA